MFYNRQGRWTMDHKYDIRKHLTSQVYELLISTAEKLYESNMKLTKEILELQETLDKERTYKEAIFLQEHRNINELKEYLENVNKENTSIDHLIDKSLAIINKE
jgi:DNA-binding protein H-NS